MADAADNVWRSQIGFPKELEFAGLIETFLEGYSYGKDALKYEVIRTGSTVHVKLGDGARMMISVVIGRGTAGAGILGRPVAPKTKTMAEDSTALHLPEALQAQFDRLQQVARLGANWDSYGAEPIAPRAVDAARRLISTVAEQFSTLAG